MRSEVSCFGISFGVVKERELRSPKPLLGRSLSWVALEALENRTESSHPFSEQPAGCWWALLEVWRSWLDRVNAADAVGEIQCTG